jgi:hypothetical protein
LKVVFVLGELRASIEGCEVVLRYDEDAEFSPGLRDALAELADAMQEQLLGEAEVQGFGLTVGDIGLRGSRPGVNGVGDSCWGYSYGGHCSWHSGSSDPSSCTIHSSEAK